MIISLFQWISLIVWISVLQNMIFVLMGHLDSYMQHTSMAPSFISPQETPFAWLWNHIDIGTKVFWGGFIFRWLAFSIIWGRCYLMFSLLGLLSIFREDVMHMVNPMLRWVLINPLTFLFRLLSSLQFHMFDQNLTCQVKVMVTFPKLVDSYPFPNNELLWNATFLVFQI